MVARGQKLPNLKQPVWERQPGEPAAAYSSFIVYRDLGSLNRTYAKVKDLKGFKSEAQVEAWASQLRWVERCNAWDAYLRTIVQGEQEKGIRAMAISWETRAARLKEEEWELAELMRSRMMEMLQMPLTRETIETGEHEGQAVIIKIIEPTGWGYRDIAAVAREASKIGRLAAEMPTDGARQQVDQGPKALSDIDAFLVAMAGDKDETEAKEEEVKSDVQD